MSRCFPYPPPGYSSRIVENEALIESIKGTIRPVRGDFRPVESYSTGNKTYVELQKEREAKAERKNERKREKKEKRRERKERIKDIPNEICHGNKRKVNGENIRKGEKSNVDLKEAHIKVRREDDAEQLERSGLTEEHDHPVGSQNPCYSADSTQNSNKRRKHSTPSSGLPSQRNIIRIRLPVRKQNEPDASVNQERFIPSSARTDLPSQHTNGMVHGRNGEESCYTMMGVQSVPHDLTSRPVEEPCNEKDGIFSQDHRQTSLESTSFENETERIEFLYRDLVENWVQPALPVDHIDDQEWLFDRKHQDRPKETSFRAFSGVSSWDNSTLWPRAKFLPEADIYALPLTVPF